ncbi:MAG TPA: YncE family protein, partial [Accumulibacter sp.]|nr:YncE family protein [Accumulibacter sp.]
MISFRHRLLFRSARLAWSAAIGLLALSGSACAGLAIALNSADGTLSLIDTETYAVTGKVSVCKEPHHLMPTLDDKSLIVACAAANQLVFFDPLTGKEQRRIRDISDPYQLGYSPDKKWFVATSLRLDRVDLYDPADFRLKARLPAAKTPSHLAFDDASEYVFVTLQDSNQV